ncbi:MAG TPA: Na+/H+ antiporter NhaC family protein, partial [Thermoanaerobaculia bacterium]|nr:Na+/H+ antiporter NhaC family protein [Thermoanaerobaculia bacterium]
LALLFKDVLVSLFVGVFSGALILHSWNPITAFARSIDSFVAPALAQAEVAGPGDDGPAAAPAPVRVLLDGREVARPELGPGEHDLALELPAGSALAAGSHAVAVEGPGTRAEATVRVLPGWLSVLPPLIAIGLALLFKDVLVSLFVGVFSGALILHSWNPITAFARSIDSFVAPALADDSHARILIFSTLLGGMVGVISKSGGTRGIVEYLSRFASNTRRGQLATWAMGVAIFFDDYANTLIVGSTMRPVTDRLRISREKLAYIVDSTAAPVASVVPISTWIGFEIGLIGAAFADLGLPFNPYLTFIDTIPYRFYPLFALVLGFTIAATDRDFGPMYTAERRAMTRGEVLAEGDRALADYSGGAMEPRAGIPHRAINAVLPILTVVVVTLVGLWVSGAAALDRADYETTGVWVREVFGASDPYNTLLWASLAGVVVAVALPLAQRLVSIKESMAGMVEGFKAMLLALVVLILAWSIGAVCDQLRTAEYLVAATEGVLSPHWLPVLVFLLAAATAFATGTSWGTMSILVPLVIPICHGLAVAEGLEPAASGTYYTLMLGTISSVLAGAVWGDHCSPISDTTILSSMATGCDHIAHVRTQLPYALGIGVLGMVIGDIPTAYGLPPWVSLVVGTGIIVGGVLWLGKKVPVEEP